MNLHESTLNDYLSPSAVCIKPPVKSTEYSVIKDEEVTINLTDCLACSGCVTSAESFLINLQSQDEFKKFLSTNKSKILVVSLSPQSRASFAAKYDIPVEQVNNRLAWFFNRYSETKVFLFDTTFSRDISLIETGNEFIAKFKMGVPLLTSACPGWICYAEKTHSDILPFISSVKSPQQVMGSLVKGYFAEFYHRIDPSVSKLNPSDIYHLSIMPCYDKKLEASRSDFKYTVQEKTLESDEIIISDVDCVLSTIEIEQVLKSFGFSMSTIIPNTIIPFNCFSQLTNQPSLPVIYNKFGSGSGGYLERILEYVVPKLFPVEFQNNLIQLSLRKLLVKRRNVNRTKNNVVDNVDKIVSSDNNPNADNSNPTSNSDKILGYSPTKIVDYAIWDLKISGETKLTVVRCFGFRNIQNLVKEIEKAMETNSKQPFDFVEVMACPSGCTSGGGQLKPNDLETIEQTEEKIFSISELKAFSKKVEKVYQDVEPKKTPEDNYVVEHIYSEWLKNDELKIAKEFHTQYHVIKDTFQSDSMNLNW